VNMADLIQHNYLREEDVRTSSSTSPETCSEDAESDLSNGGDLAGDLDKALSGDFDFEGSYYYASSLPEAPDPLFEIHGQGLVALPLTEHGAETIISCARQAPFGKGQETIVDKKVRDTWELHPSQFTIQNEAWDGWVRGLVEGEVCQGLGISSTTPTFELYKMLLYEKGSHFLPHQDTAKSERMFATLVIVLPSEYSGGQVHLSHAGMSKTLDYSESSSTTTAALAWYTDVMHSVKPVTSGYRLALSYNLIHAAPPALTESPTTPLPTPVSLLPRPQIDKGATELLHKTLSKWAKGKYGKKYDMPCPPFFARLLKHEYSQHELESSGIRCLKGSDAHQVGCILAIGEDMGFVVGLANLEVKLEGPADECGPPPPRGYGGYGYGHDGPRPQKRQRLDEDDEDKDMDEDEDEDEEDDYDEEYGFGNPTLLEVESTSYVLDFVVDAQGRKIMPDGMTCPLETEAFIPQDPSFDKDEPDDEEYEGYMGNESGTITQYYHRTVLILYHLRDQVEVLFGLGHGISWGLEALKASPTANGNTTAGSPASTTITISPSDADATGQTGAVKPSGIDKDIAYAILGAFPSSKAPEKVEAATALFGYAIKWNMVELWENTLAKCNSGMFKDASAKGKGEERDGQDILARRISEGLAVFGFEPLSKSLETYLERTPSLKEQVQLLEVVAEYNVSKENRRSGDQAVVEWVGHRSTQSLKEYETALVEDIPVLLALAKKSESGVKSISGGVVQNLRNTPQEADPMGGGTFPFLVALAEAMWEARDDFTSTPVEDLTNVMEECITLCVPQWSRVPMARSNPAYFSSYHSSLQTRNPSTTAKAKVDRITTIVELCLRCLPPSASMTATMDLPQATSSLLPCQLLLADVLKDTTPVADKFKFIYTPLLTGLKEALSKYGKDFTVSPFKDVVKGLVELYMDKFVGRKDEPYLHPSIKKIGCGAGCTECREVDQWIVTPDSAQEHNIRAKESIRRHVEIQLSEQGGAAFLTWSTIKAGSPHTLSIRKKSDVDKLSRWDGRVKEARKFLQVIGRDEECRKVMGEREWQGIQQNLGGRNMTARTTTAQLAGASTGAERVNQIQGAAQRRPNANTKAQSSTAARSTNPASSLVTMSRAGSSTTAPGAGQKRKRDPNRPVVRGSEVIDLTELSP
ncbi:hypothetical protein BKA70DRAFT_1247469, partial [Coprinopsis sp. MPI-PUGE-AT-0042]